MNNDADDDDDDGDGDERQLCWGCNVAASEENAPH